MKKTKLEKIKSIKKNLENRLTKLNNESFRLQAILLENRAFFNAVENVLNKNWSSNDFEKNHWFELLFEAKNGDEDALIELRAEFKYNENFKKETGVFANV